MYLLFVRSGESSETKRLTTGQIEKKDGTKKVFTLIPGSVEKLDFDYGDKVVCLQGSFMMIIHADDRQVAAVEMFDRYWLPVHEVTLTEEFIKQKTTKQVKLPLTGVNHRVMTGAVLR